jgi:hypothetical protein
MTDKSNYQRALDLLALADSGSSSELLQDAQVRALLAIADAISVMFRNKQIRRRELLIPPND